MFISSIIEGAGAKFDGIQKVNGKDKFALATDPQTLSTYYLPIKRLTKKKVKNRSSPARLEAHGRRVDIAVGITTSGNSRNVLRGLQAARERGLRTAALLGRDGGAAAALADSSLVVPVRDTARIQEVHIFAGHLLCRRVEDRIASHTDAPTSSGPEGS